MDIEQNKSIKAIHDSVSCQSKDKCLWRGWSERSACLGCRGEVLVQIEQNWGSSWGWEEGNQAYLRAEPFPFSVKNLTVAGRYDWGECKSINRPLPFSLFFFFLILFIYLFLAVLGLHFCVRAFSSCGERGPLFIAVRGPLTIAASLVAEHKLQTRKLSSCGSRA